MSIDFLIHLMKQTYDFWRHLILQPIGVIIVNVLIMTGNFIVYKQFPKKSLIYNVNSVSNLLSKTNKYSEELEIKYKQEPINNLYLVIIDFINNGNIAIKPIDIKTNITINSGINTRILSARIVKQTPDNLGLGLTYDLRKDPSGDYVNIFPFFLNRNDYFRFELMFEEYKGIKIDGRIVNVKEIKHVDLKAIQDRRRLINSKIMLLTMFLIVFVVTIFIVTAILELKH